MRFLITGGTGFIGSYLRSLLLKEGHFVTVITRKPEAYRGEQAENQQFISWEDELSGYMEKTDVVINLAGENVFKFFWSEEVKKTVYQSRIGSTRRLVEALENAGDKPALFISSSTVGYYGDKGDKLVDEQESPGDDFFAGLCIDWEKEARKAEKPGVRVAIARMGIPLEEDGGMIKKMKLPFLLFVGGPVGHGRQYIPWIHMRDLCNALLFPTVNDALEGPYNIGSPAPVTMNELAGTMGRVMNRPSFFRVPEFVVKIALGEAAKPALSSVKLQPKKLQENGFVFEFEDVEEALADVL